MSTVPASTSAAPATGTGLENLRDIHLPPPVSWWPPAPGWWLLVALIAVAIIFALWLIHRARRRRYRKLALAQLQRIYREWQTGRDDLQFARGVNQLLKQTAIAAYSAAPVAALSGADWLDFLDRKLAQPRFHAGAVRALATLYAPAPEPIDADALYGAARAWIRSHRC